jgi:drug/metabolite transporter (DMT)-like permease
VVADTSTGKPDSYDRVDRGWLLVTAVSPRLSSQAGAMLLLLTPVGAVALSAAVLGERPSAWQLAGCAPVLASVLTARR